MATPLASLLPNGKQQFLDSGGHPLENGQVFMFVPGTTTLKTTWTDPQEVNVNTNPIHLDGAGEAVIYGSGQYRQVVVDKFGNQVWDQLTQDVISLIQEITGSGIGILANIAALRALTAVTANVVWVEGYRTLNDGGEGMFVFNSTDTTTPDNGGTVIVDAAGQRWERSTQAEPVNVVWFGAVGDAITDDTNSIQQAVATGRSVYMPKPVNQYLVKNFIHCITPGQTIYGDGKGSTQFIINNTFNLAAAGVFFVETNVVPGPQFKYFSVNFIQPDTSTFADLVNYPPAFFAEGQPRCFWDGIKITAAMVAIDILGDTSGGSSIINSEISCFSFGIRIDGAEDSITVHNCRFEPDTLTANQQVLFNLPTNAGIDSARCDDLHVNCCLFFIGQPLVFTLGTEGSTFGEVTNCDFDTDGGIDISSGEIVVAGCSFTLGGSTTNSSILQSGGAIRLTSCWFLNTSPNAIVIISPGVAATMIMTCCEFNLNTNVLGIEVFNGGFLTLGQCRFNMDPNTFSNNAVIIDSGGVLNMQGCSLSARIAGIGNGVDIVTDGPHNICGNTFNGWPLALPAGHSVLIAANNNP